MSWAGEFYFGECWVAFRGKADDNTMHAHAALQISIAQPLHATLSDANGTEIRGGAVVVKPGVQHRLHPLDHAVLILIEPQSPLATYLFEKTSDADIDALPSDIAQRINVDGTLADCLDGVLPVAALSQATLDSRLEDAIAFLDNAPLTQAIAKAAESVGLSEPRLRAIARDQLGVPLSKWLTWRKLGRAARELATGADLAAAAMAGGFADQAHFTRTMRDVVGITPGTASRFLA